MRTINNQTITADRFAYDGCHKIYLLDSIQDDGQARGLGYEVMPIDYLPCIWSNSCPLRFIKTWRLEDIVEQGESATFAGFNEKDDEL